MEAIRQIVDSNLLSGVIPLPEFLRNKKVEVIVFPADKSVEDSHREYILRELKKADEYARGPGAIWHDEDDVFRMLEEPI